VQEINAIRIKDYLIIPNYYFSNYSSLRCSGHRGR